jgi:hypothetical protein
VIKLNPLQFVAALGPLQASKPHLDRICCPANNYCTYLGPAASKLCMLVKQDAVLGISKRSAFQLRIKLKAPPLPALLRRPAINLLRNPPPI